MADNVAVHPLSFKWNVNNHFLPWRRVAAVFYHGSPTLTIWRVTLEPMKRHDRETWPFSFSLRRVEIHEEDTIFADKVVVNISEVERNVARREVIDYSFNKYNQHSYRFETSMTPGHHRLLIKVEISFPTQTIVNRDGNGLQFQSEDLIQLSKDLKWLFTDATDSNLRLRSKNNSNIPVHSCILRARWQNFFKEHPVNTIANNTVDTHISQDLLFQILTFMYSGELDLSLPIWRDPSRRQELFQVTDRYHLYHLYRVFARDESTQVRRTFYDMSRNRIITLASQVDGKPSEMPGGRYRMFPRNGVAVDVNIKFFLRENNPWFLYSITFTCSIELHARVHLQYHRNGERKIPCKLMHEREYQIRGNETVESGTCHFEGDRRDFDNFLKGTDCMESGKVVRHSFHFILILSDGSKVVQIFSTDHLGSQPDGKRFEVLSDHMSELLKQRGDADARTEANLQVVCRSENPDNQETHRLHKAIFAARVRRWWAVLQENLPERNDALEYYQRRNNIPDEMPCFLSSGAFNHVLDYIYTGKMFPIPHRFLDEIRNFAVLGGVISLRKFVEAII